MGGKKKNKQNKPHTKKTDQPRKKVEYLNRYELKKALTSVPCFISVFRSYSLPQQRKSKSTAAKAGKVQVGV